MINEEKLYQIGELVKNIKNDSRNVYQTFSIGILLVVLVAAYVLVKGQYLAGIALLALCFIGFFLLFPAQQITKDIAELEKIIRQIK